MNYERTWAEISLGNLAHNMQLIKSKINGKTKIMAIVKADAYGHGAIKAAETFLENGASLLGVATCDEGTSLREAHISAPILLLGFTPFHRFSDVLNFDLTQTIFSVEAAKELSKVAENLGKTAKIHIKLDSGMHRIGFMLKSSVKAEIMEISALKNIEIEGVFTHFAQSEIEDQSYTEAQFAAFSKQISELESLKIKYFHVSNSGAIIFSPHLNMDIVRPGIMEYGIPPTSSIPSDWTLKRALQWKTQISHIKTIENGESVGYNRRFIADSKMSVATLPVGYADGYFRLLSNKGKVLINGEFAPVVGGVCMDQCMVDVTKISSARVCDEVVLIGRQGENEITTDDISDLLGTNSHEIVCAISKRVPRIHVK